MHGETFSARCSRSPEPCLIKCTTTDDTGSQYTSIRSKRVFWDLCGGLLGSTTAVRRVGFESGPRDSMTFGWSTTRVGGRWISLAGGCRVERFSASGIVGNGTFTHVHLTDPKYSGATTTSLLQRA